MMTQPLTQPAARRFLLRDSLIRGRHVLSPEEGAVPDWIKVHRPAP